MRERVITKGQVQESGYVIDAKVKRIDEEGKEPKLFRITEFAEKGIVKLKADGDEEAIAVRLASLMDQYSLVGDKKDPV